MNGPTHVKTKKEAAMKFSSKVASIFLISSISALAQQDGDDSSPSEPPVFKPADPTPELQQDGHADPGPVTSYTQLHFSVRENGIETVLVGINISELTPDTPSAHTIITLSKSNNGYRRTLISEIEGTISLAEKDEIGQLMQDANFKQLSKESRDKVRKLRLEKRVTIQIRIGRYCYPEEGVQMFTYISSLDQIDEKIKPLFNKLLQITSELDVKSR